MFHYDSVFMDRIVKQNPELAIWHMRPDSVRDEVIGAN